MFTFWTSFARLVSRLARYYPRARLCRMYAPSTTDVREVRHTLLRRLPLELADDILDIATYQVDLSASRHAAKTSLSIVPRRPLYLYELWSGDVIGGGGIWRERAILCD
ncbi:hypothetical protein NEOLEDRAFT_990251 [Neolentinus lepideus HHB14362 ss-1]|uniref:Uncharacterized protein n=1 Tax=Neolentinus lepideus HHB14362 ss-1 TaxID=1314782 RepID=A0A165N4P2_9AGAM|nr:hypothetical protein NEOLEDRAFT_990251 [Neolentinus lepideus HHB14362 ss-1]